MNSRDSIDLQEEPKTTQNLVQGSEAGQVGEKTDTILTDSLARLNSSLSLSIFSVSIPFLLLLPPIQRGSIRIVCTVNPLPLRRGNLFSQVLVPVK